MVGLNDVGMNEIGHQAGFTDEVLLEFGNRGVFFADQLDRHTLAEVSGAFLKCFVNEPHAAVGDFSHHFVKNLVTQVLELAHVVSKTAGSELARIQSLSSMESA